MKNAFFYFHHNDKKLALPSDIFIEASGQYISAIYGLDLQDVDIKNQASQVISRNHPVYVGYMRYQMPNYPLDFIWTHDPSMGASLHVSGKYFIMKKGNLIFISPQNDYFDYNQVEISKKKFETMEEFVLYAEEIFRK